MFPSSTKILLVEDDPDDYVWIEDLLHRALASRFDLKWVDNYLSALEAIDSENHDVCLLDYHLGDRDGIEILREVMGKRLRHTGYLANRTRVLRRRYGSDAHGRVGFPGKEPARSDGVRTVNPLCNIP